MHLKNNNRYKIKTPSGYQNFSGIRKLEKPEYFIIDLSNGETVVCSTSHPFICNGIEVESNKLKIGSSIDGSDGKLVYIKNIQFKRDITELYDIVNVSNGNVFNTNGIVSHNCDFLTSGVTLVDLSTIEWYKECVQRDPAECRGVDRSLWIWEYPDYSRTYIVSADVSRGDGGDYSACHVLDAETLNQCAEYKGQIDLVSFGHMLVNIATEYNKALLIVENTGIGFGTIQTIIDSGYPNTFYTSVDLKYVELQKQIITKYYSEEKKMVPGFSTTVRTRPLIISRLEQYFRDKAVNIYSSRTLGELETFIWDKGKVVAMSGYNDDLCMSLGIGLWVRDTALRLKSESVDYSRAMANGMKKSEYTGSSAVFTNKASNSGYESWNMKVGKSNQRENLHWLL